MSVAENLPMSGAGEASILIDGARYDLPIKKGTIGPDVIDIATFYQETGVLHLRPRLHLDRELRVEDHLHRRRQGHPALSRLSDRPAGRDTAPSWRPATSCSTASCRRAAQYEDFEHRITNHTMVHEQMTRFYTGFRRDAHPMAVMVGVVGALSAFYHDSIDIKDPAQREMARDPHDRQDADHRRDGVQIFDRPAVHLSAQRARLLGELPAYVLRGAVRGLQGQSGARARDATASSSCMPTTSRTPRPRRCGSPAHPAPIRSPASRPASPASGARPMAAPTRRR